MRQAPASVSTVLARLPMQELAAPPSGLTRRAAQVIGHLGAQRSCPNRPLELLEEAFKFGWRYRPGNELLQQLLLKIAAVPPCPPLQSSSCVAFMLLGAMPRLTHKISDRIQPDA